MISNMLCVDVVCSPEFNRNLRSVKVGITVAENVLISGTVVQPRLLATVSELSI